VLRTKGEKRLRRRRAALRSFARSLAGGLVRPGNGPKSRFMRCLGRLRFQTVLRSQSKRRYVANHKLQPTCITNVVQQPRTPHKMHAETDPKVTFPAFSEHTERFRRAEPPFESCFCVAHSKLRTKLEGRAEYCLADLLLLLLLSPLLRGLQQKVRKLMEHSRAY
jgi:hypothetical protein